MFDRSKNEPRATAGLTLGAVSKRLRENGFEPVSALEPFGRLLQTTPPIFAPHAPHLLSEHPPAVVVRHPLAVLVLTPLPENPELEQRIRGVLEKRGLMRGPCRIGSDNREARPLRLSDQWVYSDVLDGAVRFDQQTNTGAQLVHSVLPLDASWPDGDLLTVPYAKLPQLGEPLALFEELRGLPLAIAAEKAPPREKPTSRLARLRKLHEERLTELASRARGPSGHVLDSYGKAVPSFPGEPAPDPREDSLATGLEELIGDAEDGR
ncbi:MAG: hypothetical protein ACRETP_01465 [Steroidobacteraceae bacterium]